MQKSEANPMRCGAKARSGHSCKSRAMKNGRCRMHGGTSPGAPQGPLHWNYKHGYWTKNAIQKRRETAELIKSHIQICRIFDKIIK